MVWYYLRVKYVQLKLSQETSSTALHAVQFEGVPQIE